MRLYDIAADMEEILDRIAAAAAEEDGGEISDADFDALDATEHSFAVKVENTAKYLEGVEVDVKAFKAEAKRLSEHARARSNTVARLKAYLMECLRKAKTDRVDGDVKSVRIQRGAPKLYIEDANMTFHVEYYTTPMPVLNKAALKDAIAKHGKQIDGASVVDNFFVRIV